MLILGIETSCDETSAAVVQDGRLVRSSVVSSQIALHVPYGGVVPEIASRQHVRAIPLVVSEALRTSGIADRDIDAVAATRGPGLAGALLVGVNFARGLSLGLEAPFIGVNHLEGHLHSVWLTRAEPPPPPPGLPMVALIVSGGHTELVLVAGHGEYRLLGRTLDDAAGEAFDKVARLLGLPYPGGPSIQAVVGAAEEPIAVPRAWLPGTFDFSFSGVKTAVLHLAIEIGEGRRPDEVRGRSLSKRDPMPELSEQQVANIAAGFQESVVDVLVRKTVAAAKKYEAASVAVVGGVAANRLLRQRMEEAIHQPLFISAPEFSTDNAAMIASAAYYTRSSPVHTDVVPGLQLPVGAA